MLISRLKPYLRVNPHVLLAVCLGIVSFCVAFEKIVNDRRSQLEGAREAYLKALALTRTQLASHVQTASVDDVLINHARWDLDHSLGRALEARLHPGVLDQLSFVTSDCQTIAEAARGAPQTLPCPEGVPFPEGREAFFWLSTEAGPGLGLMAPMKPGDKTLYVIGLVHLSSSWFAVHPALSRQIENLNLIIGKEPMISGRVILREGLGDDQIHVASLGSTSAFDRWMPLGMALQESYVNPFIWPGFLLCGLLTLFGGTRQQHLMRRHDHVTTEFLSWCKSLTPMGDEPIPKEAHQVGEHRMAYARRLVESSLQDKAKKISALEQMRRDMVQRINAQSQEIKGIRARLAELAELDSLAHQLERTATSFLDRMDCLQNGCTDLDDIIHSGLLGECHNLRSLLNEWQQGIRDRGSRKFLRSLSETRGREANKSLLDDQLELFQVLVHRLDDQAMAASNQCRELVHSAQTAVRVADYWKRLAGKSDDEHERTDLNRCLSEAQELLRLERGAQTPRFENAVEDFAGPSLPGSVLVAAIYNIYLALLDHGSGFENTVIITRIRQTPKKTLLVVTLEGTDGWDHHRPEPSHLERAKTMVEAHGLSLTVLPLRHGPYPIALNWGRGTL